MMIIWQAAGLLLFLEVLVFIGAVAAIGFFKTMLACLLSAMIGGWLVRSQGAGTMAKVFSGGAIQTEHLYDSLCLLFAGLLFIFPGFISDLIAFALIVPMVRHSFRAQGIRIFTQTRGETYRPAEGDIIEGNYKVVEEDPQQIERQKDD